MAHRRHRGLLGLAAGLCLALPAVAAEAPGGVNLWPIVRYRHDGERTEVEFLATLGFYERTTAGVRYGLRPFFTFAWDAKRRRSDLHVFYPIATFQHDEKSAWRFVFPFYFHSRRPGPSGKPVTANVVFPFFWWGRHSEDGPWFAVLFVGGVFKGLLGADRVDYNGFTYTRVRTGDYVTEHIISPFGTRWRGPGRRGFRIWPFYCHVRQEGRWENGYIMWPFYCYGSREAGEGRAAGSYFASWPFYGRSWGRDGKSGSVQVLWPFFYHGWNEHKHLSEWDAPFPFYTTKSSDDLKEVNLWPLWGRTRTKGATVTRLLSSLIRHARVETKNTSVTELRVLPFFAHARSEDRARETRRSYWEVWPLWRSRSRQEGGATWGDATCPQLGWTTYAEGFDRNYGAIVNLYGRERERDGSSRTRALLGLVRAERGPERASLEVGPLVSWQRSPGLTRLSFLLGLVQTGASEGRRGWRILGVPVGARLRQPAASPAEGPPHGQ